MSYFKPEPGEVWKCRNFPYNDMQNMGGERPCLIVGTKGSKYHCMMITSYNDGDYTGLSDVDIKKLKKKQGPEKQWKYDVKLPRYYINTEPYCSFVRVSIIRTLSRGDLVKRLKVLDSQKYDDVMDMLDIAEAEYLDSPLNFMYWLIRHDIQYAEVKENYGRQSLPVKSVSEIQKTNAADCIDIALAVADICKEENLQYMLGYLLYKTKREKKPKLHLFVMFKENSKVKSMHLAYNGFAYMFGEYDNYKYQHYGEAIGDICREFISREKGRFDQIQLYSILDKETQDKITRDMDKNDIVRLITNDDYGKYTIDAQIRQF